MEAHLPQNGSTLRFQLVAGLARDQNRIASFKLPGVFQAHDIYFNILQSAEIRSITQPINCSINAINYAYILPCLDDVFARNFGELKSPFSQPNSFWGKINPQDSHQRTTLGGIV
jgi:hypothetical protein